MFLKVSLLSVIDLERVSKFKILLSVTSKIVQDFLSIFMNETYFDVFGIQVERDGPHSVVISQKTELRIRN